MEKKFSLIGIILIALLSACDNNWDEHYNTPPETVNQNIWDAIQAESNLSTFVKYLKEFKYDTLFLKDDTYTLFIPDNEAFEAFLESSVISTKILDYHISPYFVQVSGIVGKRKLQLLTEKFALFESSNNESLFDNIPLEFESPLYLNGKYYVLGEVALPKPNLFEYFEMFNPVLKNYILDLDSIILDKEGSRPLGFDDFGNTVYDTVSIIYNEFEEEYFPVRKEYRNKTATIVFPTEDDYNYALTVMAESLGDIYQDYKDIPLDWQNKILIPHLLVQGVFENMLEPSEFIPDFTSRDTFKMKNILGDSVIIDYLPAEKTICSNGYAYNYSSFTIPDTLYTGATRIEGESTLRGIGINKFAFLDEVTVVSDVSFAPIMELVTKASNDSILRVPFTKGYSGRYSLEFGIENLFPRRYLMVVRTHMYIGGLYEIYVNDELVATINYYDYVLNRELWTSVTGIRYKPEGGFNKWDCWVNNNVEYGKAKIRFKYIGPAKVSANGLVIDYIDFIPEDAL